MSKLQAEIRPIQRWPYPLWEVWHTGVNQRYAGGFFTKRGARRWIAEHREEYL